MIRPVSFMTPSFSCNACKKTEDTPQDIFNKVTNSPLYFVKNQKQLDELDAQQMDAALAAVCEKENAGEILERMFITEPKERQFTKSPNWLQDCSVLEVVTDSMSVIKPELLDKLYNGYFKSGHSFKAIMTNRCETLLEREIAAYREEARFFPLNKYAQINEKSIKDNIEALYGVPY